MNDTVKASTGRRYSFWEALGFSFFSKDLYSDVGKNWKGTAYGWLFLMVLLMSILPAVNFQMFVSANLPDSHEKNTGFPGCEWRILQQHQTAIYLQMG